MQKIEAEKSILGKIITEIRIRSTHNLRCQKFASVCRNFVRNFFIVCRKIAAFCPAYYF